MAIDPFDRIITTGFFGSSNVDFDPSFAGSSLYSVVGGFSIFVQSLGIPNATCLENLTLNNISSSGDYYASESITGNGTVSSGTINYQAHNFILLDQGFSTGASTVFKASIGGCP